MLRSSVLWVIAFLSVHAIASATPLDAQQSTPGSKLQPTLEETGEFLTAFLAAHELSSDTSASIRKVAMDSCILREIAVGHGTTRGIEWVIDLGRIDPLSIRVDTAHSGILMNTTADAQVLRGYAGQWDGQAFRRDTLAYLYHEDLTTVDGAEALQRIERALKHAVSLCGGKAAPF